MVQVISMTGPELAECVLSTGDVFADRYAISVLLGRGGMGSVYQARDLALGEDVALKVLAPALGLSPVSVLRFRQEVRLSRRVTHPNVIRVYDIGEHQGVLYMTMELVLGRTLAQRLAEEGPLDLPEAIRVGIAVSDGLAAAHAASVVHRDLKPSNVLLAPDGRVALTDFGIAQSLIESSDLTLEGTVVGTRKYMAPEHFAGAGADQKSDIYCLGVLLHEMLTGDIPAREQLPTVVIRAAASRASRLENPALGPLADIVARCLRADPDSRPSSAGEVSLALSKVRELGAPIPAAPSQASRAFSPASVPTRGDPAISKLTLAGRSALAVLPFQYVGPAESAYLGRVISDELCDTLAQVRGLRVLGTGATAAFAERRDVLALGRALDVPLVLDGTLQLSLGSRVRLTVRLVETSTGEQRWSARHDGAVVDLLAFQIAVARVLAEKLRLELTVISHSTAAPPEAIELYFAGRRDYRTLDTEAVMTAVDELGRCLVLAPTFGPALSALALANVRAWFFGRGVASERDWEASSRESLARALAEVPDLPETQLAAAMFAIQLCRFPDARAALDRALSLAPTFADALEYLGMLLCEAAHLEEGFEKLSLVSEIDPTRPFPLLYSARAVALTGDFDRAEEMFARAGRLPSYGRFACTILRVRAAAWRGVVPQLAEEVRAEVSKPRWELVRLYLEALEGAGASRIAAPAEALLSAPLSPRARTSVCQILSEIWLIAGEPARAIELVVRAADIGLLDLLWLDGCPLLAPLRAAPELALARRKTALAADAMR